MKDLGRGAVKRIAISVSFPDGHTKTFEHEIGDDFGGVLFDDGLVTEFLKNSGTKVKALRDGVAVWNGTDTKKPSYLLIPRIEIKERCAAAKTGQCVGGGDCDNCPSRNE